MISTKSFVGNSCLDLSGFNQFDWKKLKESKSEFVSFFTQISSIFLLKFVHPTLNAETCRLNGLIEQKGLMHVPLSDTLHLVLMNLMDYKNEFL